MPGKENGKVTNRELYKRSLERIKASLKLFLVAIKSKDGELKEAAIQNAISEHLESLFCMLLASGIDLESGVKCIVRKTPINKELSVKDLKISYSITAI